MVLFCISRNCCFSTIFPVCWLLQNLQTRNHFETLWQRGLYRWHEWIPTVTRHSLSQAGYLVSCLNFQSYQSWDGQLRVFLVLFCLQTQIWNDSIPLKCVPHGILCFLPRPDLKLWELTWPVQNCLLEVWDTVFLAGNLQLTENAGWWINIPASQPLRTVWDTFYVLLRDPCGNRYLLSGTVTWIN